MVSSDKEDTDEKILSLLGNKHKHDSNSEEIDEADSVCVLHYDTANALEIHAGYVEVQY